jgi:hypothetical protein
MNAETLAAMERLGKMTWIIHHDGDGPLGLQIRGSDDPVLLGCLFHPEADELGLTPGMEIQILPVGKGGCDER